MTEANIARKAIENAEGARKSHQVHLLKNGDRVMTQYWQTSGLAWAAGENWKMLDKDHDYIVSEAKATGGEVEGRSHDEGGEKFEIGSNGHRVELEDKEGVLRAEAMLSENEHDIEGTPREMLHKLNKLYVKDYDESKPVEKLAGGEGILRASAMQDARIYKMTGTPKHIISCLNEKHKGVNFRDDNKGCGFNSKEKGGWTQRLDKKGKSLKEDDRVRLEDGREGKITYVGSAGHLNIALDEGGLKERVEPRKVEKIMQKGGKTMKSDNFLVDYKVKEGTGKEYFSTAKEAIDWIRKEKPIKATLYEYSTRTAIKEYKKGKIKLEKGGSTKSKYMAEINYRTTAGQERSMRDVVEASSEEEAVSMAEKPLRKKGYKIIGGHATIHKAKGGKINGRYAWSHYPKLKEGEIKIPNKIYQSPSKDKKLMVLAKRGNRQKVIHFGKAGFKDYLSEKDKELRGSYIKTALSRKDKRGRLTKNNPFNPNYWTLRILWNYK